MFYWKGKTGNNLTLSEELLSCGSIKSVQIATAFLSGDGVAVVRQLIEKYQLTKERITLYLSEQFSPDKPGDLLEQLYEICTVKVLLDQSFHAKVFLLAGVETKLIYGSSNLTAGGFVRNVEFDYIGTPSSEELMKVKEFFDYCERHSTAASGDMIAYYKEQQPTLDELMKAQRHLKKRLTGFFKKDDPFSEDKYDLSDSYFSFEDYETFFPRNVQSYDSQTRHRRLSVQEKMLIVHRMIYPQIRKLGIAHHKREKNITSTIEPNVYNHHSVGWIGIRYGKLPHEIDWLNAGRESDDDAYGFQKHGCLQFSINSSGFDINLFLAVRNDAIDRMKLSENQFEMLFNQRSKIETEMKKLVGHGFEWRIENGVEPFQVDNNPVEIFCDWFKINDSDGYESYLTKYYEPDDPILKNKENVAIEVIRVMSMLQPLYDAMVWRPLKK
ncbi:MAG: phospholipase D family protein [Saccharofermentanales bacterium]